MVRELRVFSLKKLNYISLLFLLLFLNGCAQPSQVKYSEFSYDYIIPSPYKLTKKHQNIYFDVGAQDLFLPEESLYLETLKLDMVDVKNNAQVLVHIQISDSFLIERPVGVRKEAIFDKSGKGRLQEIAILRGHIRTHYHIEVVDVLNDNLIDHFSGAENYPIEALDQFNKAKNIEALKATFMAETIVARYEVISGIWQRMKKKYLMNVRVIFAKDNFKLVSEFKPEPRLALAYDYLYENNKKSAAKALQVYNSLNKKYKDQEDELSLRVMSFLDKGISVSTRIVNHEYEDRYSD